VKLVKLVEVQKAADDDEYRATLRWPDDREMAVISERQRESFTPDAIREELPTYDPVAAEALRPVLSASQPSKFRILVAVCPKNHELARVYRTAAGPVVVGKGPSRYVRIERLGGDYEYDDPEIGSGSTPWSYEWEQSRLTSRHPVCFLLGDIHSRKRSVIPLQCRCRSQSITVLWFYEQIDAGHRRAVHDEPDGRPRVA
jgi:hypothetical protein